MDGTRIVHVSLDDGTIIAVEVVGGAERDVARLGPINFTDFTAQLEAVARTLAAPITKLQPNRAAVEFGCSLAVESGKLTTLLVNGTASATLKVTLEWTRHHD